MLKLSMFLFYLGIVTYVTSCYRPTSPPTVWKHTLFYAHLIVLLDRIHSVCLQRGLGRAICRQILCGKSTGCDEVDIQFANEVNTMIDIVYE